MFSATTTVFERCAGSRAFSPPSWSPLRIGSFLRFARCATNISAGGSAIIPKLLPACPLGRKMYDFFQIRNGVQTLHQGLKSSNPFHSLGGGLLALES